MGVLTTAWVNAFPAHAASTTIPLAAAAAPTKHQQAQPSEIIMVYGDSLSAAYGMQPKEGWASLLEARLATTNAASKVTVVNASISGETTSGGASRIKTDLSRHQPTIVLLALGANDGLRGLPIAEMRRNLKVMLDAIRKANARAVLIGIQIPPNYGIDYSNQFKDTFVILAREQKLPLVPFLLDGIADKFENFLPDRLHPTPAAQPRILENVLSVVAPMLKPARVTQSTPAR